MGKTVAIDRELALDILEVLSLTPVYSLLNSEYMDELGADFKPDKFRGHELEHAQKAAQMNRALLAVMTNNEE